METRVRFIEHETDEPEVIRRWHLWAKGVSDGEFTACGLSVVDYPHKAEDISKLSRVTCEQCLETVKYYKKIFLKKLK